MSLCRQIPCFVRAIHMSLISELLLQSKVFKEQLFKVGIREWNNQYLGKSGPVIAPVQTKTPALAPAINNICKGQPPY